MKKSAMLGATAAEVGDLFEEASPDEMREVEPIVQVSERVRSLSNCISNFCVRATARG
jgi:hypothetical protein